MGNVENIMVYYNILKIIIGTFELNLEMKFLITKIKEKNKYY